MKITTAEFITSVTATTTIPKDHFKHIGFVGRSNVGKSSLMNELMGQKLARTSATPGKTRELNFFLINKSFYFVDMPGYGYAKVSHKEQEKWKVFLESYFKIKTLPHLTIQVVDVRHVPTTLDLEMSSFLHFHRKPFAIVLTKSDKLGSQAITKAQQTAKNAFPNAIFIQTFSAQTGKGKKELAKFIGTALT